MHLRSLSFLKTELLQTGPEYAAPSQEPRTERAGTSLRLLLTCLEKSKQTLFFKASTCVHHSSPNSQLLEDCNCRECIHNGLSGVADMPGRWRALAVLPEVWVWFPAPSGWLKTICNSSPRGSCYPLLWPLWALNASAVYTSTQTPTPHTYFWWKIN